MILSILCHVPPSVELVELTTSDFKPAQTIPQFSSQIDAADLFPETGTDYIKASALLSGWSGTSRTI